MSAAISPEKFSHLFLHPAHHLASALAGVASHGVTYSSLNSSHPLVSSPPGDKADAERAKDNGGEEASAPPADEAPAAAPAPPPAANEAIVAECASTAAAAAAITACPQPPGLPEPPAAP